MTDLAALKVYYLIPHQRRRKWKGFSVLNFEQNALFSQFSTPSENNFNSF